MILFRTYPESNSVRFSSFLLNKIEKQWNNENYIMYTIQFIYIFIQILNTFATDF